MSLMPPIYCLVIIISSEVYNMVSVSLGEAGWLLYVHLVLQMVPPKIMKYL